MGRPSLDTAKILEIHRLRSEGKSIDAILAALEDSVSRGSVAKYIKRYNNLPESVKKLGARFQWHRLEEYGLPWEAGAYLLAMCFFLRETRTIPLPSGAQVPIPTRRGFVPTIREARWWWRIHLAGAKSGDWADGKVPPTIEMFDVFYLARRFSYREMESDILDRPLDMADLEDLLIHQPWADRGRLDAYLMEVREGRIARLRNDLAGPEHRQVVEAGGGRPPGPLPPEALGVIHDWAWDFPYLLMSQRMALKPDSWLEFKRLEESNHER